MVKCSDFFASSSLIYTKIRGSVSKIFRHSDNRLSLAENVSFATFPAVGVCIAVVGLLSSLSSSVAIAQAASGGASQPPWWTSVVPLVVVFAVMYLLVLRPQSQRLRKEQSMISALKRGDEVVTKGGILGRIEGMTDQYITLEVASGVKIKVLRASVGALASNAGSSVEAKV
jgi:preprotein translocase subunit YajC